MNDSVTKLNSTLVHNQSQTVAQNLSLSDRCTTFSEMEYIPWDNPDNIVSAKVEAATHRMKDTALVLLFLIGGPGNVINMAVFYRQGLKDRVNLCLFALSLSDELYLIMAMCHHAEQAYLQFTTKQRYGFMITFLANNYFTGLLGFLYVSPVLTAIIASERCYCVLKPLQYQTLMRNRTMAAVITVVYVVVVGLYFIVAFRFHIGCVYDPHSGRAIKTTIIGQIYKNHKELIDYMDSFVYGVGLPGVVMIVVIAATIITIIKLRQIVTWRAEASSFISPREVALTKMLVGTSIVFIICVLPSSVARICWLVFPEMNAGRRNHNFYLTTLWIGELLTYINSSFNIFVYYAMGTRYSLLTVLFLTLLLVTLSEQLWARKIKIRWPIRRRWIVRYRNYRTLGKRAADSNSANPCPGIDMESAQQTLDQLKLACPQFDVASSTGLSKKSLDDAFEAADADKNNILSQKEMELFGVVIDSFEACSEAEAEQGTPVNDEMEMPLSDEEMALQDEMPLNDDEEEEE